MNIGYARVSASHQNLDRQIALLKSAGCKQIFKEKQSGREGIKRPQLDKAIDALSPGDVLVVGSGIEQRDHCSTAFGLLSGLPRSGQC